MPRYTRRVGRRKGSRRVRRDAAEDEYFLLGGAVKKKEILTVKTQWENKSHDKRPTKEEVVGAINSLKTFDDIYDVFTILTSDILYGSQYIKQDTNNDQKRFDELLAIFGKDHLWKLSYKSKNMLLPKDIDKQLKYIQTDIAEYLWIRYLNLINDAVANSLSPKSNEESNEGSNEGSNASEYEQENDTNGASTRSSVYSNNTNSTTSEGRVAVELNPQKIK